MGLFNHQNGGGGWGALNPDFLKTKGTHGCCFCLASFSCRARLPGVAFPTWSAEEMTARPACDPARWGLWVCPKRGAHKMAGFPFEPETRDTLNKKQIPRCGRVSECVRVTVCFV